MEKLCIVYLLFQKDKLTLEICMLILSYIILNHTGAAQKLATISFKKRNLIMKLYSVFQLRLKLTRAVK